MINMDKETKAAFDTSNMKSTDWILIHNYTKKKREASREVYAHECCEIGGEHDPWGYVYRGPDGDWFMSINGEYNGIEINYCPMCGVGEHILETEYIISMGKDNEN